MPRSVSLKGLRKGLAPLLSEVGEGQVSHGVGQLNPRYRLVVVDGCVLHPHVRHRDQGVAQSAVLLVCDLLARHAAVLQSVEELEIEGIDPATELFDAARDRGGVVREFDDVRVEEGVVGAVGLDLLERLGEDFYQVPAVAFFHGHAEEIGIELVLNLEKQRFLPDGPARREMEWRCQR